MLEVLLHPLSEGVWDLVEAYELLDAYDVCVVAGCARVQALDDGAHVTKDTGIHQSCTERVGGGEE